MDRNVKVYHGKFAALGVLGNRIQVYSRGLRGKSPRWDVVYRSVQDAQKLEEASRDRASLKDRVDQLASRVMFGLEVA